jgi:ketosteroid isomerase-like protein
MPEQVDVDRIRAAWEAWNQGDPSLALAMFTEDVEFEDPGVPDSRGEVYHGHEGVLKAWARWAEPWEEFTTELDYITGAGERIVSVHSVELRGKGSGVPMTFRYCYVYTLRDGQVMQFRTYLDPEEAFNAAGVPEADRSFA